MGSHLLRPGDPRLAFDPDPLRARAILMGYVPHDDVQGQTRARILAFLHEHENALSRTCLEGHLTAAALVLDHAGERALLTHHKKLGKWLQLGGHVDGEVEVERACLREAQEESGMARFEFVAWAGDEAIEGWMLRGSASKAARSAARRPSCACRAGCGD